MNLIENYYNAMGFSDPGAKWDSSAEKYTVQPEPAADVNTHPGPDFEASEAEAG